jgi:hypothetical protein
MNASHLTSPRLVRSRTRASAICLMESLESRTLLSANPSILISMAGQSHDTKPPAVNAPINVQNLVGTPVDISPVVGVKFRGDVATLTSDMRIPPGQFRKLRASIDWGDGTTSTGWFTISKNKTIHVKGAHKFASTGTFAVTVTISAKLPPKKAGTPLVITDTATVTQNSATGTTINPVTGTPFTGSVGAFSLPAGDTTTDPASFKAYIKWGDGTRSLGSVTLNPDGTYDVAGTHTYASAGTFRITILVYQQPATTSSAVTPKSSEWTCDSADLTRPTFIARIFSTAVVTDPVPPTA